MWTAVSYLTGRTAFKHAVPYIVSPHGMLESDALRRKALKKWIYLRLYEEKIFGRAALIHCINESERANVQRIFEVEQTSTIPNGICVSEFLRKDYQDLDTIAFIGRFHPKKGLDRLIEAVSMIPELKLWVAGSGEKSYESYISKIIDKYGMRNRVHVSGFVDEVTRAQIFRDTLFTVIPSFSEGLPMVALESLESGTPVIVSRQCNLQDVGEKVAGIIIDNNEPNTIKIAIEQMLSSDLARMSRNAHRLAKEKYELRAVASALVDAYLEVISAQSLRRA
jgi:poly(glycerol-phosphate) alpha-glucosyltransferase